MELIIIETRTKNFFSLTFVNINLHTFSGWWKLDQQENDSHKHENIKKKKKKKGKEFSFFLLKICSFQMIEFEF
jgi:hypothetical protein